jgi:hypothetical protein
MSHRQSSWVLASAFAALALSAPIAVVPTAAAEDVVDAFELPRGTARMVLVDIDNDGARDVVRIAEPNVERPDPAVDMVVEAWSAVDGSWELIGSAPLLRPAPEADGFVSVDALTDSFTLIPWRVAGDDRVLLVTVAGPDRRSGSDVTACCVVMMEVTLAGRAVALTPVDGFGGSAEALTSVDMDADGTDELVAVDPRMGVDAEAVVLRWDGTAFVGESVAIGSGPRATAPTAVGNVDGLAGNEVLFGPLDAGAMVRLSLVGGVVSRESVAWPRWQPDAHLNVWDAGGGVVLVEQTRTISSWRWPRGGTPELLGEIPKRGASALGLLEADGDAVVVQTEGAFFGGRGPVRVRVLDARLGVIAERVASAAVSGLVELSTPAYNALAGVGRSAYPYVGGVRGGLPDAAAAYVTMGNLVALDERGDVTVESMSAMAGIYPLGTAGSDDAWMAVAADYVGGGPEAFLAIGGGIPTATVTLLPAASILTAGDGSAGVEIAATVGERPTAANGRGGELFVDDAGLRVTVIAPDGASIAAISDGRVTFEAALDGGVPRVLSVPPPDEGNGEAFEATVIVWTAAGNAVVERWDLVVLRDAPELRAEAETRLGELAARVTGTADEYATVLVDGHSVELDRGGRFEATVDAAVWPRDVTVVARDPVGHETVTRLSVVGGFDYRALPWLAIVAAVTLLSGVWLFLRIPRTGREAAAPADAAVALEEVDGDAPLRDRV